MKKIFQKTIRILSYTAATVIILLAVTVELFRLFLPRIPEYQDDIKAEVSAAIGLQVEFSSMDARWGVNGPELAFYDSKFLHFDKETQAYNNIIKAKEVRVGINLLDLIFEQEFIVERLQISKTILDVRQLQNDVFQIQGFSLEKLLRSKPEDLIKSKKIEIIGENIEIRFKKFGENDSHLFHILKSQLKLEKNHIIFDGKIDLPNYLGKQINISASKLYLGDKDNKNWDIFIDADNIILTSWSNFLESDYQFQSGVGDIELAIAVNDTKISSLVSELNFSNIGINSINLFDFSGRIEVELSDIDWLVAINELQLKIDDKSWPKSSFQFQAGLDKLGNTLTLDARASYLNLDDLKIFQPWLSEDLTNLFFEFQPSGEIINFIATVSDFGGEIPQFSLSAELDKIGFAEVSNGLGIRDFSGLLRANHAGGLLETNSNQLLIHIPEYLPQEITLDKVDGSIIWRNSKDKTTIISNNIIVNNDVITSESNIQLVFYKNSVAPEIDLESDWSISDLAQIKRFIPKNIVDQNLYDWFQMALVGGSVVQGKTILNGSLDKFPFDDGLGQLSMRASVQDMSFKYHKLWPAIDDLNIELILDNTRLYTTKNKSTSAGMSVVNAKVSIPNLLSPILNIQSVSESSLESIHKFSMQSPIADFFDGQLNAIKVGGDALLDFNFNMPLKKELFKDFEFKIQMESKNGSLKVVDFNPTITNLAGKIFFDRNQIISSNLSGLFLGEEIDISMQRSKDPKYGVIATLLGTLTEDNLIDTLGLPLKDLIKGKMIYKTDIFFPSGKTKNKSPLTFKIESDLDGIELKLPAPFAKSTELPQKISSDFIVHQSEKVIESIGSFKDHISWNLAFNKFEKNWNFDRGVIMLGGNPPQSTDTKGLHIRGITNKLRFKDWLNLSNNNSKEDSLINKVRSVDLIIKDLYLLGQHLKDHRVRVDRSAVEWLIQLNGNDVIGSIFVPYNFNSDREMIFNMKKFRLPGDDQDIKKASDFDPRKLPTIRLSAAEFAFDDRYLGAVEAIFEKTEKGLVATKFSSSDTSFSINGKGSWLIDETDPLGSRSSFSANLSSSDVEQTMARLDYTPGIDGKDMSIDFDVSWSGNPRPDFLDTLNGEVKINFGNGQLKEVEPGAGRVFGLMSILALPRRLSLDFRDVFSKGFGFDEIAGTFKIENGVTHTCDLSLEGPAADIGIVGKSDVTKRTYEQAAIVYPNVGNTLPIVGAVVAGPQAIPALLIFSQIFKKPLQGVGQAYYSIDGSWDKPNVEPTDSLEFVKSSEKVCQMLAEG
ncbi:MAG: TIGR02099 family protein [Gammaproteobacteria bacterium]|nr:TIGR02099 family protein [Gammaproteobacteria bacterium]